MLSPPPPKKKKKKKKNFTNLPIESSRSIILHNEKNDQTQSAWLMGTGTLKENVQIT